MHASTKAHEDTHTHIHIYRRARRYGVERGRKRVTDRERERERENALGFSPSNFIVFIRPRAANESPGFAIGGIRWFPVACVSRCYFISNTKQLLSESFRIHL